MEVPQNDFEVPQNDFEVPQNDFEVPKNDFEVPQNDFEVSDSKIQGWGATAPRFYSSPRWRQPAVGKQREALKPSFPLFETLRERREGELGG